MASSFFKKIAQLKTIKKDAGKHCGYQRRIPLVVCSTDKMTDSPIIFGSSSK